jgi:cardiolipin synthase A/B
MMTVVVGLVLAGGLLIGWWKVLRVVRRRSWPPGPQAITAADAAAATEAFVADRDNGPHDVGIDYAWSTAATIEPLVEGRNFYPRILEDVERARSSVHILMFGWRAGRIGTQLADLLEGRLREGVEVRAIVGGLGSRPFGRAKDMYTRLADAGAQIVVNDSLPVDRDGLYGRRRFDWTQDEVGRAEHRKLLVIDGTVAWIGGAGIEDHFETGRFHDVMARVTGDVVRQLQAVFLMSFSAHKAPLPAGPHALERYFPTQPDPGRIRAAVLQTVPGGFQSGAQATRQMIDSARARLDLMNPYVTDDEMIERVGAAARRGVRVRLVVSERSNNGPATAALKHHYRELINAGVEIWEYPHAIVHAKLVVADDWVQVGTLNLDAWALYRNLEIALVARSEAVAELLAQQVFEPDIARSRRASAVDGDGVGNWFWHKLAYFL